MNHTVDTLYATYAADAWINFNRQLTIPFAGELRRDTDITAAEGWVRDDAYVQETLTDLWGIPADTQLYLHPIVAGRWYNDHAPGEIVVTANLARRSRPPCRRRHAGGQAETAADVRHRGHRGR